MKLFKLLIFALIPFAFFGQNPFEGIISFKMEYSELPSEMAGYETMLPSEMTITYKYPKYKMEQQMMGGSQTIITDIETNEVTSITDMMGMKIAVTMPPEDLEQDENILVEYTEETKVIANLNCKKAIIKQDDLAMELWYTEDYQSIYSKGSSGIGGFEIKGFPLEYNLSQDGIMIKVIATEIQEGSVEDDQFEIPEGYQIMNPEQLQELMGQ